MDKRVLLLGAILLVGIIMLRWLNPSVPQPEGPQQETQWFSVFPHAFIYQDRPGDDTIWNVNKNGLVTVIVSENSMIADIDCARDTTIVYNTYVDTMWVVSSISSDGRNKQALTSMRSNAWMPKWSPDGRFIAYVTDFDTGNHDTLHIINREGNVEHVITLDMAIYEFDWSPTGDAFVVSAKSKASADLYLYRVSLDGTRELLIDHGSNRTPLWSPDGTLIAYTSNVDGNWELYFYDVLHRTDRQGTFTAEGIFHIALQWTPDSAELIFRGNRADASLSSTNVYSLNRNQAMTVQRHEGHRVPMWCH